ncbi:hypothetical protein GCM10009854_39240 [Saccharopolyspora halophila]|uniref:PE domain-containing protein n=1 Tax=Saccharopolyspora halophila TaxID=405551 RepID=A0ABN3GP65_9PSEU
MTAPVEQPAGGQAITVTEDNVLEVRRTILAAAEEALHRLQSIAPNLQVTPPATDEVSRSAAAYWTHRLVGAEDAHFQRLLQYVNNVIELGEQVGEAAREYGYTDEQIQESFQLRRQA